MNDAIVITTAPTNPTAEALNGVAAELQAVDALGSSNTQAPHHLPAHALKELELFQSRSGTDPIQMAVRDALIGFMAATAQAQHEATKASQRAGIEAVRGDGKTYLGRKPSYDRAAFEAVTNMLATGTSGTTEIARATGLSRQTVLRIKADPQAANAQLSSWGL